MYQDKNKDKIEKMIKTRRLFFERTKKIANLLAKLRKNKEDSNKIKKEGRNSKTDATNKKIKRQLEATICQKNSLTEKKWINS